MIKLHDYWGSDEYSNRRAEVMKNVHGFYVIMYVDDKPIETRELYQHSERYAEDCAENYVMGIFP